MLIPRQCDREADEPMGGQIEERSERIDPLGGKPLETLLDPD